MHAHALVTNILASSPLYHVTFGSGSPTTLQTNSMTMPWPPLLSVADEDVTDGAKFTPRWRLAVLLSPTTKYD